MNAGEGSPKLVDSASKKEALFHQSRLPGNSGGRQNFRVAEGAGAAPKRSSELREEGDFRVAKGAKTAPKRSSNPTMDETGESTRCDTAESCWNRSRKIQAVVWSSE